MSNQSKGGAGSTGAQKGGAGSAGPQKGASYESLYRNWEEASWSATAIDFAADAEHWNDRLSSKQRASALWNYAMFLTGTETVSRAVTAEVAAAPGYQSQMFLATQVADAARQHVFMDRFMREVALQGRDTSQTLRMAQDHVTWGFRQILNALDERAGALTKRPQDRAILAQALVLSHLVIEGVLAIPGQHFIQRWVTKQGILPGLTSGIDNVVSDETRHVTFGTKLLNDLMAASDECRSAVVEMLDRCTPWTVGVFIPPRRDHSYVECFDFTLKEIYAFGLRALETRVTNIGLDPGELYLVSRDDRSLTHEQRAERLLRLVEDGILGDNARDPEVTTQSLEILFEATTRSIDIELARSLNGPIEWAFTDAEPWHLVVVNNHAEVKPGRAGEPALRLELTSADWARIAVGRADPRRALLTRRLRVHGSWHAIRKLPKLFT